MRIYSTAITAKNCCQFIFAFKINQNEKTKYFWHPHYKIDPPNSNFNKIDQTLTFKCFTYWFSITELTYSSRHSFRVLKPTLLEYFRAQDPLKPFRIHHDQAESKGHSIQIKYLSRHDETKTYQAPQISMGSVSNL